jgi:hypothetical protein
VSACDGDWLSLGVCVPEGVCDWLRDCVWLWLGVPESVWLRDSDCVTLAVWVRLGDCDSLGVCDCEAVIVCDCVSLGDCVADGVTVRVAVCDWLGLCV